MSEPADQELVARALERLPLNNYEAAKVLGVAEGTIRRWRGGASASLRSETRHAVLAFLHGSGDASRTTSDAPADPEVRARLEAVESLDLDDQGKSWKIAEIAATYRAKALADLAAALALESRLAERRSEAASEEPHSATLEESDPRRRERMEQAVHTKRIPPGLLRGQEVPLPTNRDTSRRRRED